MPLINVCGHCLDSVALLHLKDMSCDFNGMSIATSGARMPTR